MIVFLWVMKMLKDKLKELRKKRGITQTDFAKAFNISVGTIGNWETGNREPDYEMLAKIADFFHVSTDYLLGIEVMAPPKRSVSDLPWINVLGRVAAGIPIEAIEEIIDREQLSPDMDRSFEYIGLKIHGDSMEPKMSEGDVVIVRLQDDCNTGDIAVVLVNGDEATCKKIKKMPEGIMLISTNPNYEPMFYSNKQIEELPVRLIGKVVELRSKF